MTWMASAGSPSWNTTSPRPNRHRRIDAHNARRSASSSRPSNPPCIGGVSRKSPPAAPELRQRVGSVAAPRDLVARERGRGRDVQGREPTLYGDPYEHVAPITGEACEPPALGAEHEHDRL